MNHKIISYLDIIIVYLIITLIVYFSPLLMSLGGSIPIKMTITLLVYVAMAAVPFFICRFKKLTFSELGYSNKKTGRQVIISLFIFTITICLTVLIPLFLGFNKSDVLNFKCSSIGILIFYIIYDFLFVGFGEEFIFRGYFLNRIDTAVHSKAFAVILSSILFGLWHYPHNQDILQVIVTTLIGLVYGYARVNIKNCTVLSVSIAHGLQDSTITLLSYFLL